MPQLMPLLWFMSVIMSLFLMFMLVDMYFYSKNDLMKYNDNLEVDSVMMMW